ncbi:unnamed protein product, partial [Prorocentrum cordatum]
VHRHLPSLTSSHFENSNCEQHVVHRFNHLRDGLEPACHGVSQLCKIKLPSVVSAEIFQKLCSE